MGARVDSWVEVARISTLGLRRRPCLANRGETGGVAKRPAAGSPTTRRVAKLARSRSATSLGFGRALLVSRYFCQVEVSSPAICAHRQSGAAVTAPGQG